MNSLRDARRIVFKVGTSTLTHAGGRTNIRRLSKLCSVLADLKNAGYEVALVSSGAIGVGVGKLGLPGKPADTAGIQAAACVGQCELMFMYDKFFSEFSYNVGQLLITKADVDDPERRQHLIDAMERMFAFNVIPIINENDSVAVEEIVFGDNDTLSAVVAKLCRADALVIITDIDGFYSADPNADPDARLIPIIEEITPEMRQAAGDPGTSRGTGGMVTKLRAAGIATEAGIDTVIMNGADPTDIYKLVDGRSIGTYFKGRKTED